MAVSYDAYSELTAEDRQAASGNAFIQWTHTPSGTPKGILVYVVAGTGQVTAADNAITSVTYGGVTMTLVDQVHLSGASEPGSVWLYELLSGIPTGAQTVRANTAANPTSSTGLFPWFHGFAISMASGGNALARGAYSTVNSNAVANPSVTLDPGTGRTGLAILGGWSGKDTEASVTAGTNCTIIDGYDWVASVGVSRSVRQTTPATGSFAVAFTATSDEAAMIGATYYESALRNPMGTMGFFG